MCAHKFKKSPHFSMVVRVGCLLEQTAYVCGLVPRQLLAVA